MLHFDPASCLRLPYDDFSFIFIVAGCTEKNNSKAIYLYCEAAQGVCEIGYIKLTLKFLLTLSRMPGYRLYSLYSDTSERNEIKLDDPEVLSNFISL